MALDSQPLTVAIVLTTAMRGRFDVIDLDRLGHEKLLAAELAKTACEIRNAVDGW